MKHKFRNLGDVKFRWYKIQRTKVLSKVQKHPPSRPSHYTLPHPASAAQPHPLSTAVRCSAVPALRLQLLRVD